MKKIVILHTDVAPDAGEDEQDCLRQAETIAEAIAELGHSSVKLPFLLDLNATMHALHREAPDMVFNLVETVAGKGSMIYFATALLDHLQMPYTGCRTDAMYLTSNKPLTKQMFSTHGIATPPWVTADGTITPEARPGTYLMKASWEDASVGLDEGAVIRTSDPRKLPSALQARQKEIGMACFAEAYIDGREFNLGLWAGKDGVQMLPPAEMLFLDYPPDKLKLLDYRAKWVEDTFEYDNTRRTLEMKPQDSALLMRMRDIAKRLWHLFGLRGYARVDFRVDPSGNPFVLEINANPCLSPDAGFAAALESAGIKYSRVIDDILQDALKP